MITDIIAEYSECEVVGFLFSADYCKWCKSFVPLLIDIYPYLISKNIEIVLVGSDKSQETYDGYSKNHPWNVLPYGDERRSLLRQELHIKTIPALLFFRKDGSIIEMNGRQMIERILQTASSIESAAYLIAGNCGISQYDSDNDDF